ncbi:MAG: hypothetical protein FWG33_01200 [Oscillospiraceae bacterium]|nr:hypothetical protein [Oscillospiraceae bacterium]
MKKSISVLLAVLMAGLLFGCTQEDSTLSNDEDLNSNLTVTDSDTQELNEEAEEDSLSPQTPPKNLFNAEEIAENLVVEQYNFSDSRRSHAFLVIENTSEFTLVISAALTVFDSSGSAVGANDSGDNDVPAGEKTILGFSFDDEFETSEYDISVAEERLYKPVTQNLSFESTSATEKEVVTVTNNGDIAAEFVQTNVLFFAGGEPVWFDYAYFTDVDNQIKPGKSITKELSCPVPYDSTIVVLTGRSK